MRSQEDESEQALRKMKQEEEEVDVETGMDVGGESVDEHVRMNGEQDDDTAWADEEADGDKPGWKMKIVMEDEGEMM